VIPKNYEHLLAPLDEELGLNNSRPPVNSSSPSTRGKGQSGGAPAIKSTVVLTRGTELNPEPVQWLWPDWLALGKFHLMAGAPGHGKTTIAMALAATVTSGGRWPDGSRCAPGNVLIWSGEDDYSDTLLPRLIAGGADRNRVFFVDSTRTGGEDRPFDPSKDISTLEEAIQQIGSVHLIVIDPVSTVVVGDSHKNSEVRRGLQCLVDLAVSIGAALLGITHLSKSTQGTDPAQRVIGSIAFTAVARVVLLAARVKGEDGANKRILVRGKSNIGPDNGGIEYGLTQVMALPGINASRIEWGQAVEGSAQDLMADPAEGDDGISQSDAVTLLKAELTAEGWTEARQAIKTLMDVGFTRRKVWTASNKLKVVRKKSGMGGSWYWRLPGGGNVVQPNIDPNPSKGSKDSLHEKLEPLEPLEPSEPMESMESSSGADTAREFIEVDI
jgi:putative DNA primase/helicase